MESKAQLAQDLSKISLAGLAANAGLLGPVAGAAGAMLGTGLSGWVDRVVGGWGQYRNYLDAAQARLLETVADDADGQRALGTALAAARAAAITAREFAHLGFDPDKAAAAVADRLGYHKLQQQADDLNAQPLARRLLGKVYEAFLAFKDTRDELNLAFQQQTLQLLGELQQLQADLRPIAEAYAWTGLLQIPVDRPRNFRGAPARLLTAQRPDAFQPDLATSLGAKGMVHLNNDEAEAASRCFAEGLQRISPSLLALPEAFATLAANLAKTYLQACEAGQIEPDDELLGPVIKALGQLQQDDDDQPGV